MHLIVHTTAAALTTTTCSVLNHSRSLFSWAGRVYRQREQRQSRRHQQHHRTRYRGLPGDWKTGRRRDPLAAFPTPRGLPATCLHRPPSFLTTTQTPSLSFQQFHLAPSAATTQCTRTRSTSHAAAVDATDGVLSLPAGSARFRPNTLRDLNLRRASTATMKPSIPSLISTALLLGGAPFTCAERLLKSTSLNPCQTNNSFSATLFDVTFTPQNRSLAFDVVGVSSITGNVTIELVVLAYGLSVYKTTINPCDSNDFQGLCPMNEGQINLNSNADIPASSLKQVPGIAYTVPDLDAKVQVYFNQTSTGLSAACVEAELSNGKTVDQKGVAWTIAIISGLALVASAITSGLGHSNTAAHVAANAMALFGYFQAQAFIGMTAVSLPPIVASWTQNFQWSMGIIRVGFLQKLATWYQRATGGTPTTILSNLSSSSVRVEKRSMDVVDRLMKRAVDQLHNMAISKRSNAGSDQTDSSTQVIVRGIKRVGFRASIETSNIFLTGYVFFLIFVIFVVLGVVIFKFVCEGLTKAGKMKGEKFQDFRNGWTTVLKGILFRIVLIGYPQMVVLCFWEFTEKDSGAEVVLAVFTIFPMLAILGWAASKVIRIARRSIAMHKNPAYILYSDPVSLNKWGFLYVQFKATAYYFIVPCLIYILVKGLFIACAQSSGVAQAVALVIIEAVYLIAVCVLRPYMDKKTNAFNIAICVVNFLSAIFLLVFSNVFGQPVSIVKPVLSSFC